MSILQFESVIGLVGHKAAGKDVLCDYLAQHGYVKRKMSDVIFAEMAALGNPKPSIAESQAYSNKRKFDTGEAGLWSRLVCEAAYAAGERKFIMNGIRNPAEIDVLQRLLGDRLTLVGITGPLKLRCERALKRAQRGDPTDFDGFIAMDERDRGLGEPEEGQHTDRCMARVPLTNVYNNDGTLYEYHGWIKMLQGALEKRLDELVEPWMGGRSVGGGEFGDGDWGDPVVQYGVAGPEPKKK